MTHKILCIDDENHNLEALERLLRKKYQVVVCSSGPQALDELNKHSFSLIISDQKMPEMSGVEFFKEAQKTQPEAVRILLTGYTDLESVINAINLGEIYRYITKPWEPEEFLSTVKQALEVFSMKKLIKTQNQELLLANEQLKSLDKMKSDFMMLVNHELKTPLTGIYSFLELLKEEKLTEEQTLYLKKIAQNTQRLQDLINDTLLITKIQSDQQADFNESLAIHQLINEQWQNLNQQFKTKQLQLDFEQDPSFLQKSNSKYLTIVMKKTLHNCFTHSVDSSPVHITTIDDKDFWTIKIQNQMAQPLKKKPEELLKAFSTSENILNHSGGTGLGLAVVQAITHLFNGDVTIDSQDQKFQISLSFPK